MSEQEELRDDTPPADPDDERVEVDTEVERPAEPELSPGRLEPGTPESRPIDPRIGPPMVS
jgi:hypothetical protein